jgi:hypothetical protein
MYVFHAMTSCLADEGLKDRTIHTDTDRDEGAGQEVPGLFASTQMTTDACHRSYSMSL